jgi:integrase
VTADRIRSILDAGMAENTRRAYSGDWRQFEAWAASRGLPVTLPLPVATVLRYLTDHLEGHSIATVERRLASISTAHRLVGVGDGENPCGHPQVRAVLSAAKRAAAKEGKRQRKAKAATADVVTALLATCDGSLAGLRDRALIAVGFASGGRRRAELAAMRVDDLERVPGGFLVTIRRSKTDQGGQGIVIPVKLHAADALRAWLETTGIKSGPLFRSTNRHGQFGPSISPKAIADVVKRRAALAGLDPAEFSAHSLRRGFVTEIGRRGIAPASAMALSGHKPSRVFNGYYSAGDVLRNPAADMLAMGA